ncbi:hypothetical protein ACE1CI_36830 [Aerosakkonemataceae cyanobacterium BLCC-F50]|uniref:XPC-binding domain-containing protein n=1 Tax=Floridaenema flaviceps BLCC-F50 TaxID=3153642 RepID=A0ABV4Y3D6_9CYAN
MMQLTKLGLTTVLAGSFWGFLSLGNFANADLIAQTSDLQQVQQLIQQNPALTQQAQQLLLENPELVKMLVQQLVESNPQLLDQIQSNPQLVQQVGKQNQQLIQLLQQNPQLVQDLQQIIQNSRQKR